MSAALISETYQYRYAKKYDREISFEEGLWDVIYFVVTKPLLQKGQHQTQALNQMFHTRIIVSRASFDA